MNGDAGTAAAVTAGPPPGTLGYERDANGGPGEAGGRGGDGDAATTPKTTAFQHHQNGAPPQQQQAPLTSPSRIPRTVDDIYEDHSKRRAAILRALTEDQDTFFAACDPSRENLCLYGEPDGSTWIVAPPAEEVPSALPEPCVGINFARDGMRRSDWLSLVAAHSDAWLRAVAWYFGARLDKGGRKALFTKMNSRPSLYEVATAARSKGGGSGSGGGGGGKAAAAKRAKGAGATAAATITANGGKPPPLKTRPPGADPDSGVVLGAGGARAAAAPLATGKILTEADVFGPHPPLPLSSLAGKRCELLWPEDGLWYLVEILDVDASEGRARVRYSSGEEETLSLREVARDGHMSLLQE